jgi:hypothetical protein
VVIGRTEIERRRKYIDQLEKDLGGEQFLPLTQMIKRCLQNSPSRRPTTEQLVADIQRVKSDVEGAYGELAKLDAVRQVVIMKTLRGREAEAREKANEVLAKEEEIHQLQQQLEESHVCENIFCQSLLSYSQKFMPGLRRRFSLRHPFLV